MLEGLSKRSSTLFLFFFVSDIMSESLCMKAGQRASCIPAAG
jgi:hypothetical protein